MMKDAPAPKDRTIVSLLVEPVEPGSATGFTRYMPTLRISVQTSLHEIVQATLGTYRAMREERGEPPEASAVEENPSAYTILDADGGELAADATIGEVPKPGVVVLVPHVLTQNVPASIMAAAVMSYALEGNTKLVQHMASRHAQVEPSIRYRLDIFLSYASEDEQLAAELHDQLTSSGLRCFLASRSIAAGDDWSDALLAALTDSRVALVLLTPHSVDRPWVLTEVGAYWALRKRVVPAVAYLDKAKLPGPLGQSQARSLQTPRQITALVGELVAICRPDPA